MESETNYIINITHHEQQVIHDLMRILDTCPISMDNDDYYSIFREIATGGTDAEVDGVKIQYYDKEKSVDMSKTLEEQGLPNCWRCEYYDKDYGACLHTIPKYIELAENTICTGYKEKEK